MALDLTGDGKTVFRAGGGPFFHDEIGQYAGTFQGGVSLNNVPLTEVMPDTDMRTPYPGPGTRHSTGIPAGSGVVFCIS